MTDKSELNLETRLQLVEKALELAISDVEEKYPAIIARLEALEKERPVKVEISHVPIDAALERIAQGKRICENCNWWFCLKTEIGECRQMKIEKGIIQLDLKRSLPREPVFTRPSFGCVYFAQKI